MYLDKQNLFSDAQDVKAITRVVSTNVIDQVEPGNAKGGRELILRIQVQAAFLRAAGAIDSVFALETHTTADFSSARTVLWTSGTIAKAVLVAGHIVCEVKLPRGALQFLAVTVSNTDAADSANIDAFLTPDAPDV